MALYTYICDDCGYYWEEYLPIRLRDTPTELPCPNCEDFHVRREVGCAGFQLKGFCWSRDNYSRTLGDDPRGVQAHTFKDNKE